MYRPAGANEEDHSIWRTNVEQLEEGEANSVCRSKLSTDYAYYSPIARQFQPTKPVRST